MKVYVAGPLFTTAEQEFNRHLKGAMRNFGWTCVLPQQACAKLIKQKDGDRLVYEECRRQIALCGAVIAILDGADPDSGTCIEVGMARAAGKIVIGLRTDIRPGEGPGVNIMAHYACDVVRYMPNKTVREIAAQLGSDLSNLQELKKC